MSTSQVTQHMCKHPPWEPAGREVEEAKVSPKISALFKTWEAWRSGHGFSQAFTSLRSVLQSKGRSLRSHQNWGAELVLSAA